MCRRSQMLGCGILAFGAGVLIGLWINSGFFAHCFGVMLIMIGIGIMRK